MDENLQVKITDNALSRDLFPEDYHCLCDSENRPIKWMALEALQHAEFSTASDVVNTMKKIYHFIKHKFNLIHLPVVVRSVALGIGHVCTTALLRSGPFRSLGFLERWISSVAASELS